MSDLWVSLRKNRTRVITLVVLVLLFLLAIQGMEAKDWVITLLRGLSLSAIVFLVAAGFSLIFGLMDVMNFAHGTLFMIGAYVGWSIYVRPDTIIDLLAPLAFLGAGLLLQPLWSRPLGRLRISPRLARIWPLLGLLLAGLLVALSLVGWPIAKWVPGDPALGPGSNSVALSLSMQAGQPRPLPLPAERGSPLRLGGVLLGGVLGSLGLAALSQHGQPDRRRSAQQTWRVAGSGLFVLALGLLAYLGNDWLTEQLFALSSTWMFFMAMLLGLGIGILLGALLEIVLIRPLYARPTYQLMITLGLGVSGIELVQAMWGQTEFTMPKPSLFQGSGPGCPATSLADWFNNQCSTFMLLGGRVRVYNEAFVILVGLLVLVGVWLLLQRTRLGMIIRAGVQDSDMVEALGINVRRVFTLVFALGVGLASLGGVMAGPSMGLSTGMGESMLLLSLIAMAIGGLTSFPGAAAGSLLVGLLQMFIIKYGQIGIKLPFLAEPFKPTPPLVPASTVLLMVVILLVLPQGLFGRKE